MGGLLGRGKSLGGPKNGIEGQSGGKAACARAGFVAGRERSGVPEHARPM